MSAPTKREEQEFFVSRSSVPIWVCCRLGNYTLCGIVARRLSFTAPLRCGPTLAC
jgi:hypothetical protein